MNNSAVLAIDNKLGNIQQCPCGTIHLHCGNISLRFGEDDFINFALMVKEASSQLMDRSLFQLLESEKEQ